MKCLFVTILHGVSCGDDLVTTIKKLAAHSHWLTCGDCLCDFYSKDLAKHRRLSLWRLLRYCNTSALVFVTSFKILQCIGDCLCDFSNDLAKHRRLSLWRLLRSCNTSAIVFDFSNDLAIHRRLSLWCLLRSCNASAIAFLTSVENLQNIGDCLCDFYNGLAIHRRLSLWRLLRSCNTSVIVFVTSAWNLQNIGELVVSSAENLQSILIGWVVQWCLCDFFSWWWCLCDSVIKF